MLTLRLKDYELRLTKMSRLLYNFVGPKTIQTQIRRIAAEFCCSRASRVSCFGGHWFVCGRENAIGYACELKTLRIRARAHSSTDPTP